MNPVLGAIIAILALSVAIQGAIIYLLIRENNRHQAELLDRLMSRDFQEFKVLNRTATLKRASMNDAREAEIERERVHA